MRQEWVLWSLVFLLLCAATARVVVFDVHELGASRVTGVENSLIPVDGSLIGVAAAPEGRARFMRGASPDNRISIVIFVVHAATAEHDVSYWSRVAADASTPYISYWGVCETGAACPAPGPAARFLILSEMDPYQMRAVAVADARHQALIYRGTSQLAARIAILPSSEETARNVMKAVGGIAK